MRNLRSYSTSSNNTLKDEQVYGNSILKTNHQSSFLLNSNIKNNRINKQNVNNKNNNKKLTLNTLNTYENYSQQVPSIHTINSNNYIKNSQKKQLQLLTQTKSLLSKKQYNFQLQNFDLQPKNVSVLYTQWITKQNNNKLELKNYNNQVINNNTNINKQKKSISLFKNQSNNYSKFNNSLYKILQQQMQQTNKKKSLHQANLSSINNYKQDKEDYNLKIDLLKRNFIKKEQDIKLSYQTKILQLKKQINKYQSDKKQMSIAYEVLKQQSKIKDTQIKQLTLSLKKQQPQNKQKGSRRQSIETNRSRKKSNIEIVRRQSALIMISNMKNQLSKSNKKAKKNIHRFSQSSKSQFKNIVKGLQQQNNSNDQSKIKASRFRQEGKSNLFNSFRESQSFVDSHKNSQTSESKQFFDFQHYKTKIEQQNQIIQNLKQQVQLNGVMALKYKINQLEVQIGILQNEISSLKKQVNDNWKSKYQIRQSILSLQKRLKVFNQRQKFTFQEWGNLFSPSRGNIPAVLKRKIQGNSQLFEQIQILQKVWTKMSEYYDSLIKGYNDKIIDTIRQCQLLKQNHLKIIQYDGNIQKKEKVKKQR